MLKKTILVFSRKNPYAKEQGNIIKLIIQGKYTVLTVSIQRMCPLVPLPSYALPGSSGLDLCAIEAVLLGPGKWFAVPTGLKIEIPEGYEGQVRPRSGLALKHGVTVLNSPGTIDASYRGEIKVLLINLGSAPFVVERGMRMAQLVICPVFCVTLKEVSFIEKSLRGEGGFGSTGV